jgi:hypothetical protein
MMSMNNESAKTLRSAGVLPVVMSIAMQACLMTGCESPPRSEARTPADVRTEELTPSDVQRLAERVVARRTDAMAHTASEAARLIDRRPAIDDPRVRREIMLYEALYVAAYTSNIGLITDHYLLDPPDEPVGAWLPPGADVDDDELLLRVLAGLARLDVPMRLTPQELRGVSLSEPVHFPGTQRLATRLSVRIIERGEGDADDREGQGEGRPTVRARLTDATAHVGGTRQYVTATWDGERWTIRRDRSLVIW